MATGDDPHDQISRLEIRIEELAQAMSSCRSFILVSQAAMAGGALWLLALILGVLQFSPAALVCSIAAIIGGIVGFGSNTSSAKQYAAAMKNAEAQRDELIGSIDLRVVRD